MPALRVRRSMLLETFPVEPLRSERSRIAVELRQNDVAPFVTVEQQLRGNPPAPWQSRRAVAVRLEEVPDLLDALSAALDAAAGGRAAPPATPRREGACYGEANGARVVVLVDPTNLRRVEVAIRSPRASLEFPPEDAGLLLSALCAACVDIGLADQIVREILEREDRPMGTATH
jgi:hypothetical protein